MSLPKIYFQLKALKKAWQKSQSSDKEFMIKTFDEYINEIEQQHRIDTQILDDLDGIEDL